MKQVAVVFCNLKDDDKDNNVHLTADVLIFRRVFMRREGTTTIFFNRRWRHVRARAR